MNRRQFLAAAPAAALLAQHPAPADAAQLIGPALVQDITEIKKPLYLFSTATLMTTRYAICGADWRTLYGTPGL